MKEMAPDVKVILASGYFDPNLKLDLQGGRKGLHSETVRPRQHPSQDQGSYRRGVSGPPARAATLAAANAAMPNATAAFNDCFIPYIGMSIARSATATISSLMPLISFPTTRQSGRSAARRVSYGRLLSVCSTRQILTPFRFSDAIAVSGSRTCSHGTVVVAPRAVFSISFRGGG